MYLADGITQLLLTPSLNKKCGLDQEWCSEDLWNFDKWTPQKVVTFISETHVAVVFRHELRTKSERFLRVFWPVLVSLPRISNENPRLFRLFY